MNLRYCGDYSPPFIGARLRASLEAVNAGFSIRPAGSDDAVRVSDFYAAQGREFDPADGDVVLLAVADQRDGSLVGAAWLDQSTGICVLRKMQVDPAWQRRGVGTALLRAAVAAGEPEEIWCLPWRRLIDFYSSVGFAAAPLDSAPGPVARRLAKYTSWGLDVVLMKRHTRSATD